MRLRRAEMMAISLPEKKPLPRRSTTIEAAMKRGSDMGLRLDMLPNGAPAAALPPLGASDSVPTCARPGGGSPRGGEEEALANGEIFDVTVIGTGPGGYVAADPRRPDGPQDRDRGARPGRLRRHLPPARVHPDEGPPPHRRPLRGPQEPQGVRDRRRERRPRLPRRHVAQGPDRPPPQQGDRDLPLQEEQDHPLQGARPPRGGEGRRGEGRGRGDQGRHEERDPRHRLPAEVPARHRARTARPSSPPTTS